MIPHASPFLLSLPPATPNPGSMPRPAAAPPPAKKPRAPRKPKAAPDAVLAEATVDAKTAAPDVVPTAPAARKRKKAAAV